MPTSIITAVANAIASVFGWMTGRSAAKNAADVKAAAIAQREQELQDAANKAIQNEDTNTIRNDLAE